MAAVAAANEIRAVITERSAMDMADLLYGPVYYRWLLRTGPVSGEYTDTLVVMILRALVVSRI
jgi:hypothetical protein